MMSFLMKFLDVDTLCTLVAKAISCILCYASKKGGKAWDVAKDAISKVNVWTSLFLQVYDDDKMTSDEEAIVADAIKNKTSIAKVTSILKRSCASKAYAKSGQTAKKTSTKKAK